ncbi:MAG: alkaline phosphatase family protein [Kofleriaceae bacterium]
MRCCFVVWLAVVAACSRTTPVVAPAHADKPKLVVLIVVDQLPSWVFARDRGRFRHGFARLLRHGAFVPAAELPYANTFTAPGHATIGTGAPPSVHGVVGNQWYRRDEGTVRPAEYDRAATVFGVAGGSVAAGLNGSAKALRVDGIADVLRRDTSGKARSVAVALKARAACFVAGRAPDLAVWFEPDAGGMTTSRAYASELPAWLDELDRSRPPDRFIGTQWNALDPQLLATVTQIADDAPGEGDLHGLGVGFPHRIASANHLLHTPYGDEIVLDAAYAAIDAMQLGSDAVPDLLAIALNAHDYVGHNWGPDSWEVLDLTLRLDVALGTLFDTLDRRLGRDGWAVVLTSDHGATPVVERSRWPGARRISPSDIAAAAERGLSGVLGTGPWVAKVTASQIYLTRRWATVAASARDAALAAATAAVARLPGIAASGRTDLIAGSCNTRHGLDRAICWSIAPGESGELYVVPAAGSVITDYTTGTHHDAPFDDNRQVPILVLAPGIAHQTGHGSLLQVAPTVAALLDVHAPPGASEPPLFGIVR